MDMRLIDAHTHVQLKQFKEDRDEVIARALAAGVGMINVGTDRKDSQTAITIAEAYPEGVWATIGQHPDEKEMFDGQWYRRMMTHPKVVAIGECGLDYYRLQPHEVQEERSRQAELFEEHIAVAKECAKPLMVHCREAFSDMRAVMKRDADGLTAETPGILHFFTGTKEDAKFFIELGFMFTFGGLITFNREFDDILKYIPMDRLMVETDAPFVAPAPHRGKRNEPAYVIEVAKALGEIKGIPFGRVCEQTNKNARAAFGIE